ncbi:10739_t:CDS:2, partial [Cetraspora pellucida]
MAKIKLSISLSDNLYSLCKLKGILYLKPELDIETKWNSTYYMLQKMQKIKTALNFLAADHSSIRLLYPNNNEQHNLKNMLTLLELLEAATKLLSAALYPTMGDICLVFLNIQEYLNMCIEKKEFSQNKNLRNRLESKELLVSNYNPRQESTTTDTNKLDNYLMFDIIEEDTNPLNWPLVLQPVFMLKARSLI